MDTSPTAESRDTGALYPVRIHTPDERVRVFVSSTLDELAKEREAVISAITQLRQTPIYFESGAHPHPPKEVYRALLDQSQIFAGIYWESYGWVAPGMSISGLEDEYRRAASKPKLIYVKTPAAKREERLVTLLKHIREDNNVCYKKFETAEELRELVASDLALLLAERFDIAAEALDAWSQAQMSAVTAHEKLAQYRNRVELLTRFVNLHGIPLPKNRLGRVVPIQVPLDKVYIQLRASIQQTDVQSNVPEKPKHSEDGERRPSSKTPSAPIFNKLRAIGEYLYSRQETDESRTRSDVIHPADALRKHGRLVILGAPGAGKSTLLRYLARKSANDAQGPLPIMVRLREYATRLDREPDLTIRNFALAEAAEGDVALENVLNAEVAQGRVLWLIDGLDEARGWAERTSRLITHLPGQVIVTSRPVGYESAGLETFAQFDVLPLGPDDVGRFLQDWFGVLAEQREESTEQISKQVAHLREQLRQRPRIELLLRNPLLLTFLAIHIDQDPTKELPYERAELYRRYVEELIDRWEVRRLEGPGATTRFGLGPLQADVAREAALEGFYYLGWYLHSVYYGGLKRHGILARPIKQELIDALADYYEANENWELDKGNLQAVSRAAVKFWLDAGVLDLWVVDAEEYLFFRHMTFQEYAAAHLLSDMWKTDANVAWEEVIRPVLHHYAWHETLLLLAGQLDGDNVNNLARRVLKARSYYEHSLHRDLRLAASIIGQGSSVDEILVSYVANRLNKLIDRYLYRIPSPFALVFIGLVCALIIGGNISACIIWVAIWTVLWYRAFMFPGLASLQGILRFQAHIQPPIPDTSPFIESLAQIRGKHVTKLLISLLSAYDHNIQHYAARALLATRRDPDVVEILIKYALGRGIQDEIYTALRNIEAPIVIERLTQFITGENWNLGDRAIEGLSIVGDARSVDFLLDILNTNDLESICGGFDEFDEYVARTSRLDTVIRALGRIGGVRVVPRLTQLYHDYQEPNLRQRMRECFQDEGNVSRPRELEIDDLVSMGAAYYTRCVVVEALGQTGDPEALGILIHALDDEGHVGLFANSTCIGDTAVEALIRIGRSGSALVLEPLARILSDSSAETAKRARAIEVLGHIGGEMASAILNGILSSSDSAHRERCAAARAVGRTRNHKAVPLLIEALYDKEQEYLWEIALTTLGQIADPQTVKSLVSFFHRLDPQSSLRPNVISTLGQIGGTEAVAVLSDMLKEASPEVQIAAVEALGLTKNPKAIEPIMYVLRTNKSQSDLKGAAVKALGLIRHPDTMDALLQSLRDDDPFEPNFAFWIDKDITNVRKVAAEAIMGVISTVADPDYVRKITRALWWRTTDRHLLGLTAMQALEKAANHLAVVEMNVHGISDPFTPGKAKVTMPKR